MGISGHIGPITAIKPTFFTPRIIVIYVYGTAEALERQIRKPKDSVKGDSTLTKGQSRKFTAKDGTFIGTFRNPTPHRVNNRERHSGEKIKRLILECYGH